MWARASPSCKHQRGTPKPASSEVEGSAQPSKARQSKRVPKYSPPCHPEAKPRDLLSPVDGHEVALDKSEGGVKGTRLLGGLRFESFREAWWVLAPALKEPCEEQPIAADIVSDGHL